MELFLKKSKGHLLMWFKRGVFYSFFQQLIIMISVEKMVGLFYLKQK